MAGDRTIVLAATPGQFGTYTFTATVEDGQCVPVQSATVKANMSMPDMAIQPVSGTLKPMTLPVSGVYQTQGVLPLKRL